MRKGSESQNLTFFRYIRWYKQSEWQEINPHFREKKTELQDKNLNVRNKTQNLSLLLQILSLYIAILRLNLVIIFISASEFDLSIQIFLVILVFFIKELWGKKLQLPYLFHGRIIHKRLLKLDLNHLNGRDREEWCFYVLRMLGVIMKAEWCWTLSRTTSCWRLISRLKASSCSSKDHSAPATRTTTS